MKNNTKIDLTAGNLNEVFHEASVLFSEKTLCKFAKQLSRYYLWKSIKTIIA